MDFIYNLHPGYTAVAFGLVLFGMGYLKGYSKGRESIPFEEIIDNTISDLVAKGYIRISRQMVDGKLQDVIHKHNDAP